MTYRQTIYTADGVAIHKHPHVCTRCEYHGRNAPGKPHDPEAAAACLSCRVDGKTCGLSHRGVSWVSLDAAASPEMVTRGRLAPDYAPRDPSAPLLAGVSDADADAMKLMLCEISAIAGTPELAILFGVFHRFTFARIADECGLSVREVRQRWRDFLRRSPQTFAVYTFARCDGLAAIYATEPPGADTPFKIWGRCKNAQSRWKNRPAA